MAPIVAAKNQKTEPLKIGLDAEFRAEMSQRLSGILANTYQLTIKTHIYHWNVVGPLFKPFHELTEDHYNALFAATDIIAERIRALDHFAPEDVSLVNFAPRAKDANAKTAEHMIGDLIADHEAAVRTMREAAAFAGEADDVVTADMLTARLTFHEKALWMLRAMVAK